MSETSPDILMGRLIEWGFTQILDFLGDGINGLMETPRKRQENIRWVHVLDEESAVLKARAWAKYSEKLKPSEALAHTRASSAAAG